MTRLKTLFARRLAPWRWPRLTATRMVLFGALLGVLSVNVALVSQNAARLHTAHAASLVALAGHGGGAGYVVPVPQPLHVSGNKILDPTNAQVILHGVNHSSGEYACIGSTGTNGYAVFEDPQDIPSGQFLAANGVNSVRVPLNEDCWLGINGVAPAYSGANYQAAVQAYVTRLHQVGMYVILELHWSAPGATIATGQNPMPDSDHSTAFWTGVANAYKGDRATVFDLFNEPYPNGNQDTPAAWACWKNGGASCAEGYAVAGMQTLVTAVRATGALNLILLGGVQYSDVLTNWFANKPTDSTGNLGASWHTYMDNPCSAQACYDSVIAPLNAQVPVVALEFGDYNGGGGTPPGGPAWAATLFAFLDGHQMGYHGWTYNNWGLPEGLVSNDPGTVATAWGTIVFSHLTSQFPPIPASGSPLISRGVPAYASAGVATDGNSADYSTFWNAGAVSSLTYDLSSKHPAKVGVHLLNDPVTTDYSNCDFGCFNKMKNYTLEANAAPGGTGAPASGWVVLATVTNNVLRSREHILNLTGYNWLKFNSTAVTGSGVSLKMDVHDNPGQDDWLLLGDSITAEGTAHSNISGVQWSGGPISQKVATTDPTRYPLLVDGGDSGQNMAYDDTNKALVMGSFPGKFISVAMGSNDAGTDPAAYYTHLLSVLDYGISQGHTMVVPYVPWRCSPDTKPLNDYVDAHLATDRPAVLRGWDLYSYFQAHQSALRDCLHPTYTGTAPNGYEQYQQVISDWMTGTSGGPTPTPTNTPIPPTPTNTPIPPTPTNTPIPPTPTPIPPTPTPTNTPTPPTNDFSIVAAPTALTIMQGNNQSSTITTAVTAGVAATVNLTATVAPSGPTAALAPTSITAGGTSTLTVTVGAAVAVGTYTVTVTGTEGTAIHSVNVAVTVTSSSPPPNGIVNGTFEAGSLAGWACGGTAANCSAESTDKHSGTYAAIAGISGHFSNGTSTLTQTFTAPTGSTLLTVWYENHNPSGTNTPWDYTKVVLKDNNTNAITTMRAAICPPPPSVWSKVTAQLHAGDSYTLTLTNFSSNQPGDEVWSTFDDIATS